MRVNDATIDLIKRWEGWRGTAYRDAVGVWTIGYGHTSMAGSPHVKSGMAISKAQGEAILRRDAARFAEGVRALIKVPLNDNQFGALVSFAYNVGIGNFKRSSVLRVVNARQFDRVPRRLSLWNKAGGRVLKGLVRRRGDEAALFFTPVTDASAPPLPDTVDKSQIDEPRGKPMHKSTTNMAAVLTAVAGIVGTLAGSIKELAAAVGGPYASTIAIALIVAGAGWVIRERYLKSTEEGV